jgi:hypothetical protein
MLNYADFIVSEMSGMGPPPSGPPPPPHAFFNQGTYHAQPVPQASMPQQQAQPMPQQAQPQFAPMNQANILQQNWNPPGFVGGVHPVQQQYQHSGFNPFAAPPPPPPTAAPSTSNMAGPSHAYGAYWQQPPPSTSSFQSTPAPTAGPSRESSMARYYNFQHLKGLLLSSVILNQ